MFIEVKIAEGPRAGQVIAIAIDHIASIMPSSPAHDPEEPEGLTFISFKSELDEKRRVVAISESYESFMRRLRLVAHFMER